MAPLEKTQSPEEIKQIEKASIDKIQSSEDKISFGDNISLQEEKMALEEKNFGSIERNIEIKQIENMAGKERISFQEKTLTFEEKKIK